MSKTRKFNLNDEVWVKDLENQLPVSAVFVKYNDFKKYFKYRVIKRGNTYESDVNFCELKRTK